MQLGLPGFFVALDDGICGFHKLATIRPLQLRLVLSYNFSMDEGYNLQRVAAGSSLPARAAVHTPLGVARFVNTRGKRIAKFVNFKSI